MNWGKRGQVAIEFLLLIVITFSVFLVYTSVTRDKMTELLEKEEYILLKDAVYMARNEILIASKVGNGYYREFVIPEELDLKYNYTIFIRNNPYHQIVAWSFRHNHSQVVDIPEVVGNISKGLNVINKTGGVIYLTQ